MNEKLKVIVKKPNESGTVCFIDDSLKAMHDIVGGYIEVVNIGRGIMLVCNEEGKLQGLQPNVDYGGDVIVGTVFLVGTDGENFKSLTDAEITLLLLGGF